jgi:MFS transporter, AAHS family, benzoate transport protein
MSTALRWPVLLAWLAVALEGYDLVVLGAILPTLSADWDLTGNDGSVLSTVGLVGVAIGAVAVGTASDRFGRRPALLACVAWFSVLTLLCTVVPSFWVLCVIRFLAGLGLGGCLPVALTLAAEYARPGSSGASVTRLMTGYHVGAVVTALLAIPIVEDHGWRWMFLIGGVLGLIALPLMWARLPESASFLLVQGRGDEARALAARYDVAVPDPAAAGAEARPGVSTLLRGRFLRATLAFWVTSFMGLLLVYGLNTWLPTIMTAADYPLGQSLALLLTLNVGAVTGLVTAGAIADRSGTKPITLAWFGLAAAFLALLSVKLPLVGVYAVVLGAGIFVFSAQVLVYAYVSQLYPPSVRATAIGYASGVGRVGAIVGPIVVGFLVTANREYPEGFYLFAAVAVLGALAVSVVPAVRDTAEAQAPAPRP